MKTQRRKAGKGFTLVELVVVIAIIGVLSAILVPTMFNWARSARITNANATAKTIRNAYNTYALHLIQNGKGGFGTNSWVIEATKNRNAAPTITYKCYGPSATPETNIAAVLEGADPLDIEQQIADLDYSRWVMVVQDGNIATVFLTTESQGGVLAIPPGSFDTLTGSSGFITGLLNADNWSAESVYMDVVVGTSPLIEVATSS